MRGLLGAAVGMLVAVAACGASASPQAASHRATPTPYVYQPATQPRSETPAPAPQGQPPLSSAPRTTTESRLAAFNCKVPLSNGSPGSGGFVSIPGGTFTSDPASNVALDWSGAPPPTQTPAPGPGPGPGMRPPNYGLSYDRAAGKWLPVSAGWVAPDGQSYAYPDYVGGGVRLVKVAGGGATTMGPDSKWNVIDVETEGVYAVRFDPQGPAVAGLWLLAAGKDPAQVVASGYWMWVTSGYAYGFDAPSVPQGAPHPLLRLNLRDHTTFTWYQQGEQIQYLAGFDRDGSPIAVFTPNYGGYGNPPWLTALIPQPNQTNPILVAPQGAQQPVVRDSHGFWMEAGGLYFNEIGVGGYQVSAVGGQLAGGCG
jgi:hypothetical protein